MVTLEKFPWNCCVFKDFKSSGGCDDSLKTFKNVWWSSCLRMFSKKISFFWFENHLNCLKCFKENSECLPKFFEQVSPMNQIEMNRILHSQPSASQSNQRSNSSFQFFYFMAEGKMAETQMRADSYFFQRR